MAILGIYVRFRDISNEFSSKNPQVKSYPCDFLEAKNMGRDWWQL